jgi:2-polyprenyl-6-methoxyphenol hydroxylase-like FAD-dependent oxidoreductase
MTIHEPARETPIALECDLCIVGGSCTGVFAAVRAARLGLSVAIVEQNILLGGMATAAQVNEWHSLLDIHQREQIIGGLTAEILDRLKRRNAAQEHRHPTGLRHRFNSAELALELDAIAAEHRIRVFLKASCVAAARDGDRITAAIIEDKSGRRAIRARFFIDASGDGDLLRRAGFPAWKNDILQPVAYQVLTAGLREIAHDLWPRVRHRAEEFGYPLENASPWFFAYPAPADIINVFGARLNGVDASDADQATAAIFEGRRRQRALLDMIRAEIGADPKAVALAHALGVRETWHACCRHRLTSSDLLGGHAFPDAIARGTYPVDVHSPKGTLLRHLDGKEQFVQRDGSVVVRRWREEGASGPAFYEIPYRSLVPESAENLLIAGRLLDADREAFGGVRVMVNMNQTGEAAGVAACLALQSGTGAAGVSATALQAAMKEGGSLVQIRPNG